MGSAAAGRVVVLGDLMVDVVATASVPLTRGSDAAATVRTHGGGSAANVAAWLADAGVPVLLLCRVGDDLPGREAVAGLAAAGVDVRAAVDPALGTGTCVVVVESDGERTFLPDRGANAALAPSDLPVDAFRAGDHLHLSGYALLDAGPAREAALAALARAAAAGMAISVDPASSAPLRREGGARFLAWVVGAGTLLPNADEAAALTGEADPETAARALAHRSGAEVVVTLGAAGALWSDGARVERAPAAALPAGRVASAAGGGGADAADAPRPDSTGAGDAFSAGWLAARRGGAPVTDALAAANALGARAVALPGARPQG